LRAKADERNRLGLPTEYDRTCFHLQKEESDERAYKGQPFVVRLIDPESPPKFVDLVFGRQDIHADRRKLPDVFEDPILLKSDGFPTYHLANVVDDHHMKITHVIRGSEWLISTRKHISLYNAFGWNPPTFAHVGLLLDGDGSKLSKRDKAFDISLLQKDGVLPEALNNFLVLLGWSHRQKSDVMSMRKLESKVRREQ
jgi:glutamyl-tRNA synthetase